MCHPCSGSLWLLSDTPPCWIGCCFIFTDICSVTVSCWTSFLESLLANTRLWMFLAQPIATMNLSLKGKLLMCAMQCEISPRDTRQLWLRKGYQKGPGPNSTSMWTKQQAIIYNMIGRMMMTVWALWMCAVQE